MSKKTALQNAVAFVVGLLFAIGLAIAGMTQPQKIIGFLDPPNWDASLAFVMFGAVGVHLVSYSLIRKRRSPVLDTEWHVPKRNDITLRLIIGSAIFGVGWGLGGYCPGPGWMSIMTGDLRPIAFVIAMVVGMLVFKKVGPRLPLRE